MELTTWIVDKELSEIEKNYFLAVAKALALSQRFESNLKTLAFESEMILLQNRDNNMPSFEDIVERAKKNSTVFSMIKHFNKAYSNDDIANLLDKAREARNQIVHCSLDGSYSGSYGMGIPMKQSDFGKVINDQSYKKKLELKYITEIIKTRLEELKKLVYDLALGDFYAGIIEWNVNIEPGNYPFTAETYADRIVTWVFSEVNIDS